MYCINQLSDNIKANKAKCFDSEIRFAKLLSDSIPVQKKRQEIKRVEKPLEVFEDDRMAHHNSCSVLGAALQTNSSMLNGKNYQSYGIAISIVNGLLSPVAVLTNLLILLALWKTLSLQSASNIFVASLALADLCVGLFLQPMLVFINRTARHVSSQAFCVVFQFHMFLAYLFTALSLGTLTYLSIERSIALHWHLRYYEIVTTKKVSITVIQLWVFQFVMSTIIWFAIGSYSILAALSVTGALCCILVICCTYINMWRIVRRHHKRIQSDQSTTHGQNALNMLKYKAKTYTSLIILELFALCYFPYLCFEVARLIRRRHHFIDIANYSILETVVFVNSSLNPIIYFWRIKDLRRAAWNSLKRLNFCHNE